MIEGFCNYIGMLPSDCSQLEMFLATTSTIILIIMIIGCILVRKSTLSSKEGDK